MRCWWVQHGTELEARRVFTNMPSSEVYDWIREAHEYHPCKPKKLVRPGVVSYA